MIYFIQAEGVGHIKIGFTADEDVLVRLADLQTGSPVPLRVLGTTPGAVVEEKNLHRRFAAHRVHGEWFRPVPELLALINPADAKTCEGVEVAERSVSIRVLTVGRKQFTKALLEQLPEGDLISWVFVSHEFDPDSNDLEEFVEGVPWGWVVGGTHKYLGVTPGGHCRARYVGEFRWVIFERNGTLYRQRDYLELFHFFAGALERHHPEKSPIAALYHQRHRLPGFRAEDQLFVGV